MGARSADGGLTIIELVIALSLTSMVVLSATGLVRTAGRAAQIQEDRLEAQQAVRRAMERITEELRSAEAVLPDPGCAPDGLCPDRVTVHIPVGNPYRQDQAYDVVFQHNARQREAERRVGRGVNNLAARIDAVSLTYLDANGLPAAIPSAVTRIRIAVTTRPRDGPPLVLESEVALRNHRAPWIRPSVTPVWRPSPMGFSHPVVRNGFTPLGSPGPSEPR